MPRPNRGVVRSALRFTARPPRPSLVRPPAHRERPVENVVDVHDYHATILHLLGIDHKRLNVKFQGLDLRLTNVHGRVVKNVLS